MSVARATQYSDLAEAERSMIFERFRQATMSWNIYAADSEDKESKREDKSHMIIVTDSCLPLLNAGESSISGHVLINYELTSKKVYSRISRLSNSFFSL